LPAVAALCDTWVDEFVGVSWKLPGEHKPFRPE
jgi:hypothetical protein